jgi:hypothetical protein
LADVDIGLGIGGGGTGTNPGTGGENGSGTSNGNSSRDRQILRQFSQLPSSERMQMLRRCGGINGGGYDSSLANLCRLLETASR